MTGHRLRLVTWTSTLAVAAIGAVLSVSLAGGGLGQPYAALVAGAIGGLLLCHVAFLIREWRKLMGLTSTNSVTTKKPEWLVFSDMMTAMAEAGEPRGVSRIAWSVDGAWVTVRVVYDRPVDQAASWAKSLVTMIEEAARLAGFSGVAVTWVRDVQTAQKEGKA